MHRAYKNKLYRRPKSEFIIHRYLLKKWCYLLRGYWLQLLKRRWNRGLKSLALGWEVAMPPPWARKVPVCYAMCAFHYLHDFIRRPGAVYTASYRRSSTRGSETKNKCAFLPFTTLAWEIYIYIFNGKISPTYIYFSRFKQFLLLHVF